MKSKKGRDGGPGENRTLTPVRIHDFESCASTSSATGPCETQSLCLDISHIHVKNISSKISTAKKIDKL